MLHNCIHFQVSIGYKKDPTTELFFYLNKNESDVAKNAQKGQQNYGLTYKTKLF